MDRANFVGTIRINSFSLGHFYTLTSNNKLPTPNHYTNEARYLNLKPE